MKATIKPLKTLTRENLPAFREFIYKFAYDKDSGKETTVLIAIMLIARIRPELVPYVVHFSESLVYFPKFFTGIFERPDDYDRSKISKLFNLAVKYYLMKKITIEDEMMRVPKTCPSESIRAAEEAVLKTEFKNKKEELRKWRNEQHKVLVGDQYSFLNQQVEIIQKVINDHNEGINIEDEGSLTRLYDVLFRILLKMESMIMAGNNRRAINETDKTYTDRLNDISVEYFEKLLD